MRRKIAQKLLNNYVLDTLKIDYALYRLLSCFLTSPAIARMVAKEGYDHYAFQQLIDEHEEKEILDSLIYSAASLRIADDLKQIRRPRMNDEVGQITMSRVSRPLSLREACNKIIHAQRLQYDIGENDDGDYYIEEYLKPTIRLFGKNQRGKRWRVRIDIRKYVESAHRAL